jgi:hypothetical protein
VRAQFLGPGDRHDQAALDASLQEFATRRLDDRYPYRILEANYEKVREVGVVRSWAVLVAIGGPEVRSLFATSLGCG